MTDQGQDPPRMITLDGVDYLITPTAFRSHYQVTKSDAQLVGLIEMVETTNGRKFTARPASGTGMTQMLMMKIAELALATGVIK